MVIDLGSWREGGPFTAQLAGYQPPVRVESSIATRGRIGIMGGPSRTSYSL